MIEKPTYDELQKRIRELEKAVLESKKIQNEYREREERYRILLEESPDPIFSFTPEGQYIYVNQAVANGVRRPAKDIIGKRIWDIFPKDEADKRFSALSRVFDTGQEKVIEVRIPNQSGDQYYLTTITPIKERTGEIISAICSSKNITERKQTEAALKSAYAKLEALWSISSLSDASLKTLADHIIASIGQMTESAYGFYGFLNEDESIMTIHSWSGEAMQDCTMVNKPQHFSVIEAGIWAEAIRTRKPLIVNDYLMDHPGKKGLPSGHVALINLMVVPFISRGRIISVAAVANRPTGYCQDDVVQLTSFLSNIQTIIDGKWAKERLEETNQLLAAVLDHTHMMAVFLDTRFNFMWVNPAYAATCGYDRSFFQGKNHFELYPHDENQAIFQRVVDTGEPFFVSAKPFEFPDRPERGVTYWDWSLIPVKDVDGKTNGLVFTLAEVTDRIRAEESLRENQANLKSWFDAISESVCLFDRNGKILTANETFAKRLGKEVADCIGESIYSLIPKDIASKRRKIVEEVISTGKPAHFEDKRLDRWIHHSLSPVLGATGEVDRLAVYAMDITDRKQVEMALCQREREMATLIDNLPGFIYRCANDRDWTMTYISEGCLQVTGYSPDDFIRNRAITFNDIVHPDYRDYLWNKWQDLLKGKKPFEEEYPIIHADGNIRWIWERGQGVFSDTGQLLFLEGFITDITKDKLLENALVESEKRLRIALEAANAGTWLWELETNANIWSDEIWRLYDLDPETNIASYDSWRQSIIPEDRESVEEAVRTSVIGEREISIEWRVNTKNEATRWLMSRGQPQRDDNGRVIRYLGIVIDITERKLAEMAVRESEEKYYLTYNSSPDAVNINRLDDGLYIDINEGFTNLTGFTREDAIGKTSLEINVWHDPADRKKLVEGLKQKGYYENLEACFRRKDGTLTTALMSARVIKIQGVPHIVSITRDISERKIAERTISTQAEMLNAVFNSMPNILAIVNSEGKIEKINHNGAAFSGRREEDILGYLGGEVFNCINAFDGDGCGRNPNCSKCPVRTRVESTLKTRSPHIKGEGQMTFLIKEQKVTIDLLISTALVEFAGTPKVLLSLTDISDLKNAEREKLSLASQLQKAQRIESIGTLAGGIAHDFNNILFPIIGLSEMLLEDLPPASPEHENVEQIFKAARRAGDLVKQILAFSRQSDNKKIPIRFQQVLREAFKLFRSTIPANIDLKQDIQNDCPMVLADPTQLHQIAMNLLTNAFHAVENAEGCISIALRKKVVEFQDRLKIGLMPGEYALLSVSDTGHGIDPTVMDKIFQPYFTTKEQGKGTGLGLATVYGIVNEHGGHIHGESEVGKGATFDVYLPLFKDTVTMGASEKITYSVPGTERIMLVDDENGIARMQQLALERLGYKVTVRTSSIEALEAFRANPSDYDLVITDMAMPNMTGEQLAREIMQVKPGTSIILCTGFSERIDEQKAKAMGIKGFVMKPVLISEMAEKIREVLNS